MGAAYCRFEKRQSGKLEGATKAIELMRQLNPKPMNEIESVERVLSEQFITLDSPP
jgi:hypothetical protein